MNYDSMNSKENRFILHTKLELFFKLFLTKLFLSVFFLITLVLFSINVNAQQRFRRHFIIAYDVSTPFVNAEKSLPYFRQALIDLFNGNDIENCNELNNTNLLIEKRNGLLFFDPKKDEISFFHFNIAGSEFNKLRKTDKHSDETSVIHEFNNAFLKDKNYYWSHIKEQNRNITDYIKQSFLITPIPLAFSGGVSTSNYVYPLILSNIDSSKYAEEYILILLSDFLTGSMQGNKMDLNRIKDIYSYPYNTNLPKNSAPVIIENYTNQMLSAYYKIDYFEFTFDKTPTHKPISIIGYKIKPKAGKISPEDVSMFVDSDLKLFQRGYKSNKFKIPESTIRFTHNNNLKPVQITLKITLQNKGKETLVFFDKIASLNHDDKWNSKYTSDTNLMSFDNSKCLYHIPELKIELDTLINRKEFDFIRFEYKINAIYSVTNALPLNFIYSTDRLINKESVIFTTKTTIIIMYYVIPIIFLLVIVIVLTIIGKPKAIVFAIKGYIDSFEVVDYKKYGKLHTPYKFWNDQNDNIIIDGEIIYKNRNYLFNWKPSVYINITEEIVPEGFDLFLKPNSDTIKEFSGGNNMPIKPVKNNKISFVIGLRQNDITIKFKEPQLIRICLSTLIRENRLLFFKSEITTPIEYNFFIGNDLGDVWVGLDPGTTGSCISVGTQADNIVLAKDSKNNKSDSVIMPSVLAFDTSINLKTKNGEVPDETYKYGTLAAFFSEDVSKIKFRSIKKLLGFKDIKEIPFKNGSTLNLTGKDLSGLLVKGLYKELTSFVEQINNPEFLYNGIFNPKRAVIAIPNNFTISKIQDIIDCAGYLKQFDEIRYVYEAEAVLFYYLSNYSTFNNGNTTFEDENILVFDMGGATINATIVSATKIDENQCCFYNVDFLGKIGYGIGGDTIDYCLIKYIQGFANEYPELSNWGGNSSAIKMQLVDYYDKGFETLITTTQLKDLLGISFEISEESNFYKSFKKDSKGNYKLFRNKIFIDLIYNNVKDAVNEAIDLSENCQIDKVIFSGRSTFFPFIKDTVEKQLKDRGNSVEKIVLEIEESKTAVAHGACWYGINKNSVRLNNLKTNASFGIKKTLSTDIKDVEFVELVKMGCAFDTSNAGIDYILGEVLLNDNFSFDGDKVNFFQIMGKDASKILSENQKHKFSKIASIRLPQAITASQMIVNENDEVECKVKLTSNKIISEKGYVSDQEITDANDEHYTWIINN